MATSSAVQDIVDRCVECFICVKECSFLSTYDGPKEICTAFQQGTLDPTVPLMCNVCGLCHAVCPKDLDPSAAILQMREEIYADKKQIHPAHNRICSYQRRGSSSLFSLHQIPDNCTTVFFPGCTLTATKSQTTEKVYNFLRSKHAEMGLVLDCCHKPSHDIGKNEHFDDKLYNLTSQLKDRGIERILTACPSCYVALQKNNQGIEIQSVYEELQDIFPVSNLIAETVTIHDACTTRFETGIHDSVRTLVTSSGATIVESSHTRTKSICCGEGGAAAFIAPEITDNWKEIRKQESENQRVITYCAGCSSTLGKTVQTTHLLDLLFMPEKSIKGAEQKTKAPFTYLQRILLKKRLQKEAQQPKDRAHRCSHLGKYTLAILLVITIIGIRVSGLSNYISGDNIQELIAYLRHCPPILYIASLSMVPVLFLPGFPFVIAGGLLYGHTWGLLYAMIGATTGAGLSFLVSRYIGNDWMSNQMAKRIDTQKWDRLQKMTQKHGWKIVILLRLTPIFPYTPLNYALGLTNIRFSHYIIATILGIFPACAAFILFSSSLWDIINGEGFTAFAIGLTLITIVILAPALYKKFSTSSK